MLFASEDPTLDLKIGDLVVSTASGISHPAVDSKAIHPCHNIYGKVKSFRKEEITDDMGTTTTNELVDIDWAPAVRNGYRFLTPVTCGLQDPDTVSKVLDADEKSVYNSKLSEGQCMDITNSFYWNSLYGWQKTK